MDGSRLLRLELVHVLPRGDRLARWMEQRTEGVDVRSAACRMTMAARAPHGSLKVGAVLVLLASVAACSGAPGPAAPASRASSGPTVRPNTGVVTTLAGTPGATGSADGVGAAATFNSPSGLAVDASGTLYVADWENDTIRKISPDGKVTTLAGTPGATGSADGVGAAATFNNPAAVAVDASGTLYVADFGNDTIRKISPDAKVTTLAGSPGVTGSTDGTAAAAGFDNPAAVAVDASGTVYVADGGNDTIRKISPDGKVTTLAGSPGVTGSTDGTGAAASFDGPSGLAVDASGTLYVADQNNDTVRKISPEGKVTTLAGTPDVSGSADGVGAAASFASPAGLALDASGTLYVADWDNNTIRKISPDGRVTTLAGTPDVSGSTDGVGAAATFDNPAAVAVDASGTLYVADQNNDTIRRIS